MIYKVSFDIKDKNELKKIINLLNKILRKIIKNKDENIIILELLLNTKIKHEYEFNEKQQNKIRDNFIQSLKNQKFRDNFVKLLIENHKKIFLTK